MKVIVYSKLATFPQVDYAEGWGGGGEIIIERIIL